MIAAASGWYALKWTSSRIEQHPVLGWECGVGLKAIAVGLQPWMANADLLSPEGIVFCADGKIMNYAQWTERWLSAIKPAVAVP